MIRITYDDERVKEYQGCIWDVYDGEEIGVLGLNHFFQASRIVKFEKQVKDLTLEELYQYMDNNFNGTAELETTKNSIIIHYVKFIDDATTDYVEYSFDDYIDITKLVKGGKK